MISQNYEGKDKLRLFINKTVHMYTVYCIDRVFIYNKVRATFSKILKRYLIDISFDF